MCVLGFVFSLCHVKNALIEVHGLCITYILAMHTNLVYTVGPQKYVLPLGQIPIKTSSAWYLAVGIYISINIIIAIAIDSTFRSTLRNSIFICVCDYSNFFGTINGESTVRMRKVCFREITGDMLMTCSDSY